jgi:peptidyl-prolyl cis-trans isomerase SurA
MIDMRFVLLVSVLFLPIITKGQLHDRRTNNNFTYNDSTAKSAIWSLYDSLQAGKRFTDLAFKYSQDPGSYKQGGELKPTTMEEYVNEYKEVVLKLTPGEMSKPFKSDFGYHIVQLVSKKDKYFLTKHILLRTD